MREKGSRLRAVALAIAALSLLTAGGAAAHPEGQHGPDEGHLLGSGAFGALEFVSNEIVTETEGLVADVTVNPAKTFAFLANWGEPDCAGPETGGQNTPDAGAWVIDIHDIASPETVGFIPHHQDSRPGEGMQVVHVTTKAFTGDVLVMNNEQCGKNGKGGVSLWNVTNPLKPYKLSEHWGDKPTGARDSNDIHSSFAWDAGDKAYVVIVDNFEITDVDIVEITNPKRPRLVAEYNLNTYVPGGVAQPELGLSQSFLHDMVVKKIGDRWILLVSYWDGGYAKLDVTNPTAAVFLGDSEYADVDPQLFERTGAMLPPEGNGHEAEFTADNRFIVATDEDFSPYRAVFEITSGSMAGEIVPAGEFGWTPQIATLPDPVVNGPVAYGGYGCPLSPAGDIPPPSVVGPLAPGEEAILLLQRGPVSDPGASYEACFFSEKVEAAQNAGYDAVVIANHHVGAGGTHEGGHAFLCGSQGHVFTPTIPAVCVGHETLHDLLNSTPDFSIPVDPSKEPAVGTVGERIQITTEFDGWGYVHLFDANSLVDLDTFAIPEGHDEAYASGFGDLTVHEVATHPTDSSRVYSSYYAGGMRALDIVCANPADTSTCDLVETGGYLDEHGNNFWGVETFVRDGQTYVLGSDRDSGLWIFRDVRGP